MHKPSTYAHNERRGKNASELNKAEVPHAYFHAVHMALIKSIVRGTEASNLFLFTGISLNDSHPSNSFLQCGEVCTHTFAHI